MRKLVALPVLSADALSSVAYATEAILAVLVLAGLPGFPLAAHRPAIAFLMVTVGFSYRQTIKAYPKAEGPTSSPRNWAASPG